YDGDPNLGGPQIGRRKIKSLTEGSNKAVSFNWTAKAGHHDIHLVLDPFNTITESIETNNKISRSIEVTIPEA
ncbi:MAG: CARDB domain-containing protein, partial [Halobacteriota archaeon]|nr:CARDB domain-containing protein [Halobacteriota archaeon]